jgi:hypothetical protein
VIAPGDVPELDVGQDAETQAALGGEDLASPYALRWDRRVPFRGEAIDLGWIGEDADGVWLRRHPHRALLDDAELCAIVTAFRLVSDREIRVADYPTRSAWWLTLWTAMLSASRRDEVARLRAQSEAQRG